MTEPRITHIGLCVSDLPRSLRFYTEGMGFVEVGRMTVDDPAAAPLMSLPVDGELGLELVYLEHSGLRVELLGWTNPTAEGDGSPRPMNRLGLTHFSIRVDEVGPVADRVRAAGGSVVQESEVTFRGGNKGLMVLDPDGTLLELIERV